jgi:PIN domain nuclease of toxin-antitoxin system
MIVGVADTHAALWYLYNDRRLSLPAGSFLDHAASSGYRVAISSISLAELVYLIEKKRLPAHVYPDLEAALDDPAHLFTETPCTRKVSRAMRQIPRADIPDMPDRIIAATAVSLQVPIISRDGYIRASAVQTIW